MITDLMPLENPLIVFDLETTGINARIDRIVQMAVIKIKPDGAMTEWSTLVNPGVPIPPDASAVHKITDAMVQGAPTFFELAPTLAVGFTGCDLCGYNVMFDIGFLMEEFKRTNVTPPKTGYVVDAFKIYQRFEPRNLSAAVRYFLNKEVLEDAHDAMADAKATLRVLRAQLEMYTLLPRKVEELHKMFFAAPPGAVDIKGKVIWGKDGKAIMNFGAHSGKLLHMVPRKYFEYMLSSAFVCEPDLKQIARDAIAGKYPVKP